MKHFKVTGMTCAACSARVEKAVKGVNGVTECAVNLLTGDMTANGGDTSEIISAVTRAGYGISEKGNSKSKSDYTAPTLLNENKQILTRIIVSSVFLLALMYITMGRMLFSAPLPSFLESSPAALGLLELILSGVILIINQKFFINGFRGVINKSPNMDTLVSLGSGASFIYSTYVLFRIIIDNNGALIHELYFESAAMILVLVSVGKLLEAVAKGKTTDALRGLYDLSPKMATVLRAGVETEIPVEDVQIDDVFVVKAGGKIPVDGVIIKGSCTLDESALTGESIPVDRSVGENVTTSSVNLTGNIHARATRVGEDTTLAQIIKLVVDTGSSKAPIAKIADKVSGVFVPAVLIIAAVCLATWLILGESIGFAAERAISVLVISCPCALGLATPVAIMVGSGVGARHGILFKSAPALESAGKISVVALDKTGTVTEGTPHVTDILTNNIDQLLSVAYALEKKSEHPLATAIVDYCTENSIPLTEAENFKNLAGEGLEGTVNSVVARAGKREYIEKFVQIPSQTSKEAEKLSRDGKTPMYFTAGNKFLGIIAVADTLKSDTVEAVKKLKADGYRVVMITGDNELTAGAIAKMAGIDEYKAGIMPGGKAAEIESLKKYGKVAMVGDGINDAPALVAADLGIAIGTGVDIAIDSADAVLMRSSPYDIVSALMLGRKTLKNIKENLFWAFIYNVIAIPLSAGVFYSFGWKLTPMLGAAAMSLSSFCVVMNALRLNLCKFGTRKKCDGESCTVTKQINIKEIKLMKTTVKIEGMMCPHCEAHAKKALEALDGVVSATASHTEKCAVIESEEEISIDLIKKAVEDAGYKVID